MEYKNEPGESAVHYLDPDSTEERALINIVPAPMKRAIKSIDPELFSQPEHQLKRILEPSLVANRLRGTFWMEYHRTQSMNRKTMNMANVWGGVCTDTYFFNYFLKEPRAVAWMVIPPTDYMIDMDTALRDSAQILSNVVHAAQLVDAKGKVDAAGLSAMIKLHELLHSIVKGPIVQRIETKSLNVNVDAGKEVDAKKTPQDLLAYAQALLAELGVKADVKELVEKNPVTED